MSQAEKNPKPETDTGADAPVIVSEEKATDPRAIIFETKDKWTIYALRCRGHVPDKIEKVTAQSGKHQILVYTFPASAWADFDRYNRGVPFPVDDIREIEAAEREFKNNLFRTPENDSD